MFNRKQIALLLTLSLVWMTACAGPSSLAQPPVGGTAAGAGRVSSHSYGQLPLYFVENRGQTDARVAFYVPGTDNNIYFSPGGLTFAFTAAPNPDTAGP